MATKKCDIDGIGTVALYKRRGAHGMRLSVTGKGDVRVTLPYWLPYAAGLEFVQAKKSWVLAELAKFQTNLLRQGQQIGRSHRLVFFAKLDSAKISSRVSGQTIRISHPALMDISHPDVQKSAQNACIRALRDQAEAELPEKLRGLSARYHLPFQSVEIKRLTGRWGSCDQQKHIVLNLFLLQLPDDLIDYVLIHELTHTKVMRHGPDFWQEFETHLPGAKSRRKQIRNYHPRIGT
jgi:predicted metal-dependent hydrolase